MSRVVPVGMLVAELEDAELVDELPVELPELPDEDEELPVGLEVATVSTEVARVVVAELWTTAMLIEVGAAATELVLGFLEQAVLLGLTKDPLPNGDSGRVPFPYGEAPPLGNETPAEATGEEAATAAAVLEAIAAIEVC